ncbi:MAG: hypothetical protein ACRDDZ_13350 [Marinifilaceae bacterium]
MATDFKLLFYIKKTEVKADGTCPIMGQVPSEKRWHNSAPNRPLMYPFGLHGQTV